MKIKYFSTVSYDKKEAPTVQCLMNLDVLVPVGAAVLVVEADSVHHLVLDVAQQVSALPDVDCLTDGQWVESHADATGARPSVLKYHVSLDKRKWKFLNNSIKITC